MWGWGFGLMASLVIDVFPPEIDMAEVAWARLGVMLRRATLDDIPALVELRAAMFTAMGDPLVSETPWRDASAAWFEQHLGVDACVYVVDLGGELISAALGFVHTATPSPSSLTDVRGHVSNVVTMDEHRRRGHARSCLEALLSWFREETEADRVDLAASDDGVALYESLGWERRVHPTLRLTFQRNPGGHSRP